MTLAAATVCFGPHGPVLQTAARLPIESLVIGRPAAEVAEILPRIFNICRAAQGTAARLALGLTPDADPGADIIREHVLKLCVMLPRRFAWPVIGLPPDPSRLLGPHGLPRSLSGLSTWDSPLAACACAIMDEFKPGLAVSGDLPAPPHPLADGAFENSAAGRQSHHPLLHDIELRYGRGPLWRYCGILADLEAALHGRLPKPEAAGDTASVPAARGCYALRLTQAHGVVTAITRRTPTDHLLAPDGALLQSLRTLPRRFQHLADKIIALHDPCIPVTVGEGAHA